MVFSAAAPPESMPSGPRPPVVFSSSAVASSHQQSTRVNPRAFAASVLTKVNQHNERIKGNDDCAGAVAASTAAATGPPSLADGDAIMGDETAHNKRKKPSPVGRSALQQEAAAIQARQQQQQVFQAASSTVCLAGDVDVWHAEAEEEIDYLSTAGDDLDYDDL